MYVEGRVKLETILEKMLLTKFSGIIDQMPRFEIS